MVLKIFGENMNLSLMSCFRDWRQWQNDNKSVWSVLVQASDGLDVGCERVVTGDPEPADNME